MRLAECVYLKGLFKWYWIQSLKRFTTSDCKDIGFNKTEFVARTQFFNLFRWFINWETRRTTWYTESNLQGEGRFGTGYPDYVWNQDLVSWSNWIFKGKFSNWCYILQTLITNHVFRLNQDDPPFSLQSFSLQPLKLLHNKPLLQ